jgi:uncharacterized SAM-binding protein YcdF (DUF218 family)
MVSPTRDLGLAAGSWLIFKSDFKTMIIIIFILTLTWINGQLNSWLEPDLEPNHESGFKIIIIIIIIFTLI